MTWLYWQLFGMVILMIFSAFFSSTEVAYTGLSPGQIKRVNRLRPGALHLWEKSPDQVLATLLLSNNAVNTGVGVLAASMALNIVEVTGWKQSLVTPMLGFLASIALLLCGEILPKVRAIKLSVPWAVTVTPVMRILSRMAAPISRVAVKITNLLLLRRIWRQEETPFFYRQAELKRIITHSIMPLGSRKILNNVIDFSRSVVSDVTTDRSSVFAISIQQPMEKIILTVIQSGFSRIPVYDGSLDNVKGILYAKDLLAAWRSGNLLVLEDLLRPVHFVNAEMPLTELLRHFRSGRQHLALVKESADDNRIKGLVTIQDALESIVGAIREES